MFTISYFVISSVIILVLIFYLKNKNKEALKYLKTIPGPKQIFPLGNAREFLGGPSASLGVFMNLLNKYGDTVLIHEGAFGKVLLTIDHDILERIYSSFEFVHKATQYEYFQMWLGKGLLTSEASRWKPHRKAIAPSFHFSVLQNFIGIFETVGDKLIKKWQTETAENVEISDDISMYALDVICESAMGIKLNALENGNSSYIRNLKAECDIVVNRAFTLLSTKLYPLTWTHYKEKKVVRKIHDFIEGIIDKRIKEQNNNNKSSMDSHVDENGVKKRLAFLDMLLKTKINDQPLSKDDLRDHVTTVMFGGHDTGATVLTFCLYMIATHPEVQKKVLEEQYEIFNGDIENVSASYNQLNDMKYLDMVLKETLRLFPPVPFFGRRLIKDTEIKGKLYPKGLTIMLFPFGAQRSPKYFSEPEKFIPERFEDQSSILPFSYTPFSAGPRNCIGYKFAMLEMLSIMSKIIRNFELGPAVPEHKIQLVAETILLSKNGVRISIKNRTSKKSE